MLTIGMPVFNDILFIEKSINSILKQTFKDFTLIISDDGSTDGSAEICKKYEQSDGRIRYIRQEKNLGISRNMRFLLDQAKTTYFMWAADDDLWDQDFILTLINLHLENPFSVVTFCKYLEIDENGITINRERNFNYSGVSSFVRLKNFINNSDDQFGYGVFRTEKIKNVQFPVWWWPNKATPYNNIFPSLCFYLAKGNYIHYDKKALFFKRVKTNKSNHILTGKGNGLKETFAYIIRRFNLVIFSSKQIKNASNFYLMIKAFPYLFYNWFIKSSYSQLQLAGKSFVRNRLFKNL